MADTAAAKSSAKTSPDPERTRAQLSPGPATPTGAPGQILRLQRSVGNRAVANLLEPGRNNPELSDDVRGHKAARGGNRESSAEEGADDERKLSLQPKLILSEPGDLYEEEADRAAEQVMRAPEQVKQQNPRPPVSLVQRSTTSEGGGTAAPPIVRHALSSPGQPMDQSTRAFFEPRFGHDFGQARIHTDAQAAESARAVNALAFTVNWDVVFGAGQYAPQTDEGKRLLAHELSHVVQQTSHAGGAAAPGTSTSLSAPAQGTVARAISPRYKKIEHNLTYRFTDWAITDKDAREVLEILQPLKPEDLKDTVVRMEADGLVGRLLENISAKDRTTHAALIQKIQEERSTSSMTAHIEELLSYGALDWAITDEEAHLALETLKSLQTTPERFKQVVRLISEKQWQRFFKQLSKKDTDDNKVFLADLKALRATNLTRAEARDFMDRYKAASPDNRLKFIETNYASGGLGTLMKALSPEDAADKYSDELREILRWVEEKATREASGMSDEEMAEVQAKYMESKRTKLAEEKIKKETPKGAEPAPVTEEKKLEAHKEIVVESSVKKKPEAELNLIGEDEAKKSIWEPRGTKVIEDILVLIKAKYPELKLTKDNFEADFDGVEKRGRNVLAFGKTKPDGTRLAVFGYAFVEAAEADAEYVMSVVVHEIFGHPEFGKYGTEYLLKLYDAAAAKLAGYTQPTGAERTSEIDNFAYQGTEIYSHLRGLPYHKPIREEDKTKKLVSIDPKSTVRYRIQLIKKNWDPKLAPALVRGLYARFRLDPRLTPEALEVFRDGVRKVFPDEYKEILK